MPILIDPQPQIVVTASREPQAQEKSTASTTIIDQARLERLSQPLIGDLLRLVPTVAVSASGPSGSLTEVRIRGAEADQTLLFIDGIRANDPAAGNAPRFELVNADLLSRIEVVRGPQSALWGSEAIGGVVAITGPSGGGTAALAEGGSFDSWRGAARTGIGNGTTGLSLGVAAQRSDGIDSFDGTGDRDGYRNLALRASGQWAVAPDVSLSAAAFRLAGVSQFDGYDPNTYLHADTLDEAHNRLTAGRLAVAAGTAEGWHGKLSASLLGSRNAYFFGDTFVSEARAQRQALGAEVGTTLAGQRFLLAAEDERETFDAEFRDRRTHRSVTAEWRGSLGPVETDAAVRRDVFSAFRDATSVRASAQLPLTGALRLAATYGEGIAQPTFYDLFGFPGFSVGNRDLKPERSCGGEVALRWAKGPLSAAVTGWWQRLTDEIVPDYSGPVPSTANADGTSRRKGIELEGGWSPSPALRLTAAWSFLNADEPYLAARRDELRRPRHSGHVAIDGTLGRWSYGAMMARTGDHDDFDFDRFQPVRLSGYWLADARVAYRLTRQVEASVRVANAVDAHYQDVVGYRTEGRSVHAGLRLNLGD